MQIAAALIGRVSAMPMRAETRIPMKSGPNDGGRLTRFPNAVMKAETPGPTNWGGQYAGSDGDSRSDKDIHRRFFGN